jgi:hypothetical protein
MSGLIKPGCPGLEMKGPPVGGYLKIEAMK